MINNIEFTPIQQKIIQEICKVQIASLTRLYEKDSAIDVELVLAQYGADKMDFKLEVASTIKKFERLINHPGSLPKLEPLNISIFRHILANVEHEYIDRAPKAITQLWAKLFLLERIAMGTTVFTSEN